jgi:RNA polymerase sigma factor (sigma-70 family)
MFGFDTVERVMDSEDVIDLYHAHARAVTGFLARRTGDPQLALDLVGETFLAALQERHQCRASGESGRSAWLYAIAGRKLIDHYRCSASARRMVERLAGELRPAAGDEMAAILRFDAPSDRGQVVLDAFHALSGEQRDAVRLRVLEEHPYSFLAQELNISEPAARARVSRGLRALRQAVAPNREGPP